MFSWSFVLMLMLTLKSRSGLPRSAGNPKGKHAGALSFGYLFFRQAKKSHSSMKDETLSRVSAQQTKKETN